MPVRIIENSSDLRMLFRYLEGQKLPMTVSIKAGGARTVKQNKLNRKWMGEIAEQLGNVTAEEIRGYCKLHLAVPIIREDDDLFREKYDEFVKPLPYSHKLAMMQEPLDFPVTRLMNTKQQTAYLDAVWHEFTEKGVILTDPGDLLAVGRKVAA
jgi:hypothetical protein